MTMQTINLGSSPNDGSGDKPRGGGAKINSNFAELYAAVLAAVPANKFCAGPAAGADALPTWRHISLADFPSLAGGTLLGNNGGSSGKPTELSAAAVKAMLGLTSTDISGLAAVASTGLFSNLVSKPTTLEGYGITDAQDYHANLAALAGLTLAANKGIYFTGPATAATFDFSSAACTLLGQSTQALMRTTGLGSTTVGDAVFVAANAAAARTALALGTSAVIDTGTSGTKVPLLDGANTWSVQQTCSNGLVVSGITPSNNGVIIECGMNGYFNIGGRTVLLADSSGSLRITNGPSFDSLIFGVSGTNFNRLKHGGTGLLQLKLADDSAFSFFQCKLRLETAAAPASASDTGVAGEIRRDGSYIYVCHATNTWLRAAIATW